MEREHQFQQQLRENNLHRERERQQEFRDQALHFHEQQILYKVREHERMRDQIKHRELLPSNQVPSARDNHIQSQHLHQNQSREIDSHQYPRSSSSSSTNNLRTQQIPTTLYSSYRGPIPIEQNFDNSRIMQPSISTSTINFHQQNSTTKPETG